MVMLCWKNEVGVFLTETIYGSIYWFISEGIIFLTFLVICAMLTLRRFCLQATLLIAGGFLLGVIGVNITLLLIGLPAVQVLGLLPLTAYTPMIICLHILSKASFIKTLAIWNVGLIGYYILKFVSKIIDSYVIMKFDFNAPYLKDMVSLFATICIAVAILIILTKYIQKPLKKYITQLKINWTILLLPLWLMVVLFFYFSWSTLNPIISALLFLTTISIFMLLSKVVKSTYEAICLRQSEKNLAMEIEMQKHDYEAICKKVESGRAYRHDMRHHLTALDTLLQQGNKEEAIIYIHDLSDKFAQIEPIVYCENLTVNAILSFYVGQAKAVDCLMNVNVRIPKELPFEDMDLCVIFSNALENAIYACGKISDTSQRTITVSASCKNSKLAVSIENNCLDTFEFDEASFPIVPKREGHGIGLKSIEAVVKKYNGFFACSLEENVFSVKAVIFEHHSNPPTQKKSHKAIVKKTGAIGCLIIPFVCLFIGATPIVAASLKNILKVTTQNSESFRWGDSKEHFDLPQIELEISKEKEDQPEILENTVNSDQPTVSKPMQPLAKEPKADKDITAPKNETSATIPSPPFADMKEENNIVENPTNPDISDGVEDMNKQMEKYVSQLRHEFIRYVSMKYQGYVGMESAYEVICNNDFLLSIRFNTTVNLGGSTQVSRIFTLDKRIGKVIELKNLFLENTNYIGVISDEIIKQMKKQGNGDYFISGGIWPDSDCFEKIEPDQNFYINDQGKLVIIFDEYVVASGSMGCPEFIIPTKEIETLLTKPSPIK